MIYFVRHGETDFNLFGISQGQLDTSLNYVGLKQAEQLSRKLKNIKFDVFYSSTLIRAKQTAEEINKKHKLKIIYDNRLVEVNKGILQGKKNTQKTYDKFYKNPHKYGGETNEDVCERINSFLSDIEKYKGKKILIVSHGGLHKYFDFCLKGKDYKKEKIPLTRMRNCEIFKFKF